MHALVGRVCACYQQCMRCDAECLYVASSACTFCWQQVVICAEAPVEDAHGEEDGDLEWEEAWQMQDDQHCAHLLNDLAVWWPRLLENLLFLYPRFALGKKYAKLLRQPNVSDEFDGNRHWFAPQTLLFHFTLHEMRLMRSELWTIFDYRAVTENIKGWLTHWQAAKRGRWENPMAESPEHQWNNQAGSTRR